MSFFKDHFSSHAEIYKKFRPGYPEELFAYLSSLSKEYELAWDCGTGNGQAAVSLVKYFKKVVATDPSAEQIKAAFPNERVEYRTEKSEESSLPSRSVDLLTIANALHWFDFGKFYAEAKRVLKKEGVIAAWSYRIPLIEPEIDKLVLDFHNQVVGPFWLPESQLVMDKYVNIPFPFELIEAPSFKYKKACNLDDLIGILNSWSATQRFIAANAYNPTDGFRNVLGKFWKDPHQKKDLTWDLTLKVGRM